jgi:hypothetical protein
MANSGNSVRGTIPPRCLDWESTADEVGIEGTTILPWSGQPDILAQRANRWRMKDLDSSRGNTVVVKVMLRQVG